MFSGGKVCYLLPTKELAVMVFNHHSFAVSSSISNLDVSAAPPSTHFQLLVALGYAVITSHYHCLERNLSLFLPSSIPVSINHDITAQKKILLTAHQIIGIPHQSPVGSSHLSSPLFPYQCLPSFQDLITKTVISLLPVSFLANRPIESSKYFLSKTLLNKLHCPAQKHYFPLPS